MPATSDPSPLAALSASLSGLVAATAPSLVSVHSHRLVSSGFVWKPGLIVTADEALAEEGEIAVTLGSGQCVAASVVGRDPTTDIALLRVATSDLKPVVLEAAAPSSGALVVAIGGREGQAVAALGVIARSGPAWRSMRGGEIDARIELDLALRSHAEGGVAIDAEGHPFGMTVFGPRRRVLVIPAVTIARIGTQLEAYGKVARGYLGLALQPVRLDRQGGMGAMVMSVDADGPGAKAGIHQGDVIQGWRGQPIRSLNEVLRALGPASVGTTVPVALRRGGETRAVDLVVGERPDR
jgi:S1-C subfamily serine protease